MIGKVIKGRSFKGAVSYVMDKKKAKLLTAMGVHITNKESIINSFYLQSRMNPKLTKCVGHIPLSYAKEDEDRITDKAMVILAREYMEGMGIENTQFIIVRHEDTQNPHCHIIYNRIDNDGNTISDKNDYKRNERVTKKLKQKYGLHFGESKKNIKTNKLHNPDRTKYRIYKILTALLPHTTSFKELEKFLSQTGIEVKYKYKGQTNIIQGISFKMNNLTYKGSEIDRKYSYSNLKKLIESNLSQRQNTTQSLSNNKTVQFNQTTPTLSTVHNAQTDSNDISFNTGSVTVHGNNEEENIFISRIQSQQRRINTKKKKKKGRGL